MATDLPDQISQALADAADDYDIDGIADAVAATGTRDIDTMSADDFWAIVAQHALPEAPPDAGELAVFQAEMAAALDTDRAVGEAAVWRRGGVTVTVSGAPRRNFSQPHGTFHIASTAGHDSTIKVHPGDSYSWAQLWEAVQPVLDEWTHAVQEARGTAGQTVREVERRQSALAEAQKRDKAAQAALRRLLREDDGETSGTMSGVEVAEYLGIAPAGVRRQMQRWGIKAVDYVRGPRRAEARYSAAEVKARAASRPGRGARTDLRDATDD